MCKKTERNCSVHNDVWPAFTCRFLIVENGFTETGASGGAAKNMSPEKRDIYVNCDAAQRTKSGESVIVSVSGRRFCPTVLHSGAKTRKKRLPHVFFPPYSHIEESSVCSRPN